MDKQVVRSICLFASISGIIQSVLWLILHITCILYHIELIVFEKVDNYETPYRIFEAYFSLFLDPHQGPMLGFYMHSYNYIVISIIYLLITIAWLFASIYSFWISQRNKLHKVRVGAIVWSVITIGLSLFDLIVLGFVYFDYVEFNRIIQSGNIIINTTYVIQILLSVRFVTFWFVNVIFSIIFLIIILKKSYLNEDIDDWPGMFNRKLEAYNNNNNHTLVRPPTPPRKLSRLEETLDVESRNEDRINSLYDLDDLSLGSRSINMFADLSNRAGNYRRSKSSTRGTSVIPVPPPLTPNPAYRNLSPNQIQRRRNMTTPSSNNSLTNTESNYNNISNSNSNYDNRDDFFAY